MLPSWFGSAYTQSFVIGVIWKRCGYKKTSRGSKERWGDGRKVALKSREEVSITGLRIGHTSHTLHKIVKHPTGHCTRRNQAETVDCTLTVKLIIESSFLFVCFVFAA